MPSTTAAEVKQALRARLAGLERSLTPAQRRKSDQMLFRRLLALPELSSANTLLLFCGMGAEPDTLHLIRHLHTMGKRVALPRCLPGRAMSCHLYSPDTPLIRHPYGMLEPDHTTAHVPKMEIDFVLVPALCYDRSGFRLGHGGGYYDRWLADFHGVTAGLCRELLLQDALPIQAHDLPVNIILTENQVFRP